MGGLKCTEYLTPISNSILRTEVLSVGSEQFRLGKFLAFNYSHLSRLTYRHARPVSQFLNIRAKDLDAKCNYP